MRVCRGVHGGVVVQDLPVVRPPPSARSFFPPSALLVVVGSARMLGALALRPMHGAGGIGQGGWRGYLRPTGMERKPLVRRG